MNILKKLIRLIQDDYKVGAEMHSGKKLIYIDPDKLDKWRLEIDTERGNLSSIASQMAEMLDEQYPGLSSKLSPKELIQLTKDSLERGPFAQKIESDNLVCIINEPLGHQIKVDQIYTTFGINSTFKPEHLRPLPGGNGEWGQLIGEHEGEHCNQDPVYNIDPLAEVKTLSGETRSDRAALATLRKEGKHEIATAFKAIRVLAAANGDDTHATSIFLDDPEFNGATEEHLQAAKRFCEEMSMSVAVNLGISVDEAIELRIADPQNYAKATEDALKKGQIPALRDISHEEALILVAKEMGIPADEAYKVNKKDYKEINDIYQRLKAEGALQNHGTPNPYIAKYIENYIDATKILFVKDTTPTGLAPAEIEVPETETPEEKAKIAADIATEKDNTLKLYAQLEATDFVNEMAKKSLGLSDDELKELVLKDPEAVMKAIEAEFQKGNIPTQSTIPVSKEQRDILIAQKMGISVSDLASQPQFLINSAAKELSKEDALMVATNNPYIKAAIEHEIESSWAQVKDYLELKAKTDAEAEAAAKAENKKLALPAAPAADQTNETNNPEKPTQNDDGKGVPQIDLRSEDRAQMKIGCMSACEYFASKANPAPTAQTPLTPAPDMGTTLNDPTVTTKVAQNSASYRNTGTGGP